MSIRKQLKKLEYRSRALQAKLGETVTAPLRNRSAADLGIVRPLPEPEPLATTLTDALRSRHSEQQFAERTISDQQLVNILWALNGVNRKDGKRTTPSPCGWNGILVYVVKSNGAWLWTPEKGALTYVKGGDLRSSVVPLNPLVARAPVHLVYVADLSSTRLKAFESAGEFLTLFRSGSSKRLGAWANNAVRSTVMIDVGAKVQTCYLACAAMGLASLCWYTPDHQKTAEALSLGPRQVVIASQAVGHPF